MGKIVKITYTQAKICPQLGKNTRKQWTLCQTAPLKFFLPVHLCIRYTSQGMILYSLFLFQIEFFKNVKMKQCCHFIPSTKKVNSRLDFLFYHNLGMYKLTTTYLLR